jgi:ATP-dependent protease ClpP protease subunit
MIYTVDASADEPIMLLNKHIGFDAEDGLGIDGALFQAELLQLDTMGKKRIQVWINSPGGNVMMGYSIFNAILKSNTPVDTYNVGIAASIAGICFMAGRKRVMSDYALLMVHPPSGSDDKKQIDAMAASLVTMLQSKSGIDGQHVKYLMDRTSWLTASECLDKGFCTDIEVTSDQNRKRMPAMGTAMYTEANKIMNSLFPTITNTSNLIQMSLTKVTMRLKLNDAATEDNIVKAIDGIEDRAYKAETEVIALNNKVTDISNASAKEKKDLEATLDKMKNDLTAKQKEYDDMKAKFDAMTEDKIKAENAAKELTAKTMVEGMAKIGRIKNDATTVLNWTKLAVADFDGTKKMMEDLPVNKVAVKIEAVENNSPEAVKIQGSAQFKMLQIANRKKAG